MLTSGIRCVCCRMFVITQTPFQETCHVKANKQSSAANKVSKIQLKETALRLKMTDTLPQECSVSAVDA